MANDYFNHSSPLTRHTLGRAEEVNGIFEAIVAGFDKLPTPSALLEGRVTYADDTGAANAYVVTLTVAPQSYQGGLNFVMKAANANTGPSTVNVNGLGVKAIKRYDGEDLEADDIQAGMLVHLAYDGTNFRILSVNGSDVAIAKASAQAAQSSASAAANSANSAASSASSAQNLYNSFRGIYYGAQSSDPATDPNGNPVGAGDWYFNTTTGMPRIYTGAVWTDVVGVFYGRTAEEVSAGVTPTNYSYPPGNVLRYGAVPDGTTDCLAAINQSIAANKRTHLPDGDFLISDSVVVPPGKVFLGSGYGTKLVASGISGAAVLLDGGYVGGGSDDPREVGRFRVTGTATIGVHCDDVQVLDLHDIWLNQLTCTNGFVFEDTFGCSIWNLYTNGALISNACFLCGQAFNANDCRNWYTSNYAYASLLLDATYNGGNGVAHGSTFTMICVQSTKYGVFVRNGQAHKFSGIYMENVVHAWRFGDYAAGLLARGISVDGGDFAGPYQSHPDYAEREAVINFDYASGCRISGGDVPGAFNCAAAAPLTFSGGGGSGASGIARVTADGEIHSVMLLTAGGGYSSAPTVTVGGAGSGGAVTATVGGGAVTGLSLDSPGSGYVPTYCPVLVKYNRSFRNEIGCLMFNSGLGEFSPMYPFVVRHADAPTNCGVTLLHDFSLRASSSAAASVEVRKTAGFGYTHAVIESASDGSRVAQVYTPPVYP